MSYLVTMEPSSRSNAGSERVDAWEPKQCTPAYTIQKQTSWNRIRKLKRDYEVPITMSEFWWQRNAATGHTPCIALLDYELRLPGDQHLEEEPPQALKSCTKSFLTLTAIFPRLQKFFHGQESEYLLFRYKNLNLFHLNYLNKDPWLQY